MKAALSLVAGLIVLVLVGCWGQAAASAPVDLQRVEIEMATEPEPPEAGSVTLTFTVLDGEGKPLTADGVQLHVVGDMPSMGHGGIEGDAQYGDDGKWLARGKFSMGGEWRVTASLKLAEETITREFWVQVKE